MPPESEKMNSATDTPLRGIRTLLQLILVTLLIRMGMDFTPMGKGDSGILIGLISLVAGIGLICWMVISRLVSILDRLAKSDESGNNPQNRA